MAPSLMTLITAKFEDIWPIFSLPGSVVAGLYCGIWLASRLTTTVPGKILASLAFSAIFASVAFFFCCVGCELGGAKLNFH